MKFFRLIFFISLSATILTGCERQLISPIDPIDPSQTNTQFAQKALSDLADTAVERGFVDLANAANEVAEVVAMKTETIAEPAPEFLELALEASALERAFVETACEIELRKFAIAAVYAVKAHVKEITGNEKYGWWPLSSLLANYPAEEPRDMEQALLNLTHEALNAETALQQFPAENPFIPFAFGYGLSIDAYENYAGYYSWDPNPPPYELGVILIQYDVEIRPVIETRTAVIEFLTNKGYTVTMEGVLDLIEAIYLGVEVDPLPIMEELITIPGIALLQPNFLYYPAVVYDPPPRSVEIIDKVRTRYNEAWCQGNFDVIDSILIEESWFDFFDYAFVRNLADIYAEEIPEDANLIQTNGFSLRPIAITFLTIHFQHLGKGRTLDEIIEIFRQTVRNRNMGIGPMGIQPVTIKHSHY